MKKSDILKQKRASKIQAQGAMIEARKKENRDAFNEAETTQFNTLDEEIRALDLEVEQAEKEEAAELRAATMAGASGESVTGKDSEKREQEKMRAGYSLHKAMRSQLPGAAPLDGVELEYHQEISKRAKEAGVSLSGVGIPDNIQKRADAQTVTMDTGKYGANLVSTDHKGVIDFLRPRPVVEKLGAAYMRNLEGNVLFADNLGGIDASWEGEITKVPSTKNEYDKAEMKPKRLASSVAISLQNLMQSSIDLEAYTIQEMNEVIALKIDQAAISGSGVGNIPQGILAAVGTNAVGTGVNGAAPTWADIVAMETQIFVKNANSAKMGYLINPGTKGFLKITPHTATQLAYLMAANNEINGYSVEVSNLIPNNLTKGTDTSNLSAAIFGDWSQLVIGEWGWRDVTVDNISRKREGLIEITINSFLDILVKNPAAFSVVKNWKLA